VGKDTQYDKKNDECRDPAPVFIGMNDLVTEKDNREGAECDDQNPSISWNVRVHGIDELCAYNDICRGPSKAC
jgi:hypothetical protein